ncbi:glycoside hydrolase family 3 C-terminal domain-containing protein [Tessaracoccus sp. MC1679]|uniref:glycoside hydrolase family 3 N-terminal domain-containing protein n=1 Tax=Tessaracoccus sp. MC1679 TaxID=2760313 RepID=UPI0016018F46|nr:glycoside hydrolase family 3 N-terminal domain-containing protein [Tessaracoccus sp. MC1679]MBB1514672.1 glycoside hydrolase family 3 C-terminal domain-containing protein [Tessaracoccus sp. MC1679]
MTDSPSYRDPSLPVEERVEDLLGRLTLEEKAGQLTQYFYFGQLDTPEVSDEDLAAMPFEQRQFLDFPRMVDKEIDAGRVGSLLFVRNAALANHLQRRTIAGNRHGIPALFGFDVIHGLRTTFPVPIAVAASWDPEVAEQGQRVAAREARAVGIHWTFAPMVDIARDPRWGRIIEGAGEEPCLGGAMAAAQVRGFQGDGGAESVISGPKHFAGYGAARGGRDYEDSDISDAELHNVYFPPFKAAIDAGAKNIMSAYMDLNGVPASGNRWLLTDMLRDELGFDGFVVSDANAVRSLETQHFARDLTDAGALAVYAGLDMEMAMFDASYTRLPQAVADGLVDEATIDLAVRRVLTAKFAAGLFEQPFVDEATSAAILGDPAHRDAAQDAAERTAVLLKNDGVLPLKAPASIAVLGDLANSTRDILGPWIFDFDESESVTLLDGIRRRAGEGTRVEYAPATAVATRLYPSMFDSHESGTLPHTPEGFDEDAELERAVALAAESEVAVVVVGQPQNMIGEKASVSTLDLPGRQLELLQRVHATGTPMVVLVMSGRPLDLRWVDGHADAIVEVWYPGVRGGDAVARVLFGDVSPAGRLPFTWPRHVGQVPMVHSHYRTFQPEEADKRYWDEESTPLYPFGHGLTYATVGYSELRAPASVAVGETATVAVTLTNTSEVDSDEVAQLYIHQRYGTSTRPVRELKGFQRVHVPAGASVEVEFELGPDQLRYWSAATRTWVQDATVIDVFVGGSSACNLTSTLEITL